MTKLLRKLLAAQVCMSMFVYNPGHDSRGQSHSLPVISLGIEGPISVPQHTYSFLGP